MNNITIKNKLFVSSILLLIIPMLIIIFILTSTYRENSVEKTLFQASANLDNLAVQFDNTLESVSNIIAQTSSDTTLEQIALKEYKNIYEVYETYRNYRTFETYLKFYKGINSIKLYCHNQSIFDNNTFIKVNDDIQNSDWFKQIINSNNKITWIYDNINSNNKNYHILYELRGAYTYKKLGIISIELDEDYLNKVVSTQIFDTYILNHENKVIASNTDNLLDSIELNKLENSILDIEYQNQKAKLVLKKQEIEYLNTELILISIIPLNFMTGDIFNSMLNSIIVLTLSFIILIVFILYFTNNISKRINKICNAMSSIAEGDFNIKIEVDGTDEVSNLYSSLKKMVLDINKLINEVYYTNLQKKQLLIYQKDIQLQMLSSQINPHFLFNTLEAIRMQAHNNRNEEISDIIESLAFMIRRNLDMTKELVTIEYEIEILETYLKLVHFRFGDKIKYNINVPQDLKSTLIPYLIIQPLVENAITHSLEKQIDSGIVNINIYDTEKELFIEVSDNGQGIDNQKLEELNNNINTEIGNSNKHIGLHNIHQRIKLIYGDKYGLTIQSKINQGTTIKIKLPKLLTQGDE